METAPEAEVGLHGVLALCLNCEFGQGGENLPGLGVELHVHVGIGLQVSN